MRDRRLWWLGRAAWLVAAAAQVPHAELVEAREPRFAMPAFVYIVRCRDGRYYVGSTRGEPEQRINDHNAGRYGGFTETRRPVELVFAQEFDRITDAIAAERPIKGWSRAKKEALMRGDPAELVRLSRNHTQLPATSEGPS